VVGYDIKTIYHELARRGIFVKFEEVHDIAQAAFIIDSLKRDRSLEGLTGQEF